MTDRHEEHYESIPWDSLVTDDARRRRRWIYLGVGVILALAIGGAVGRSLGGGASTGTTAAAAVASSTSSSTSSSTVAEVIVPDAGSEMAAAAYAEWFIADYFTVDGSEVTRQAVIDRLPGGVEVAERDGDERSFVESAFATSVEQTGTDRYRVVIVVRALAASDGASYVRQAARAVAVSVEMTPDGPAIFDLPRPVVLDTVTSPALDFDAEDAPDVVLAAARDEAALWGRPVGHPVAGRVGEVWRIVSVVQDDQGLTWPVASWFDDNGQPVNPDGG